jgi:pimeloyl-ACP methyl ester carboxylesterase
MRALFESVVASPKLFFSLARSLEAIGVINKYLLRFVVLQMDTPQKRHQVYCTWIQFRLLRFDMRFIAELINKEKIDLKVIVGKHDKVIPATDMHRLLKYVPSAHLEVIDGGHNNLIDKAAEFL